MDWRDSEGEEKLAWKLQRRFCQGKGIVSLISLAEGREFGQNSLQHQLERVSGRTWPGFKQIQSI